jgi:hypothetical protein
MGHWNLTGPRWSESKVLNSYFGGEGGCCFRIATVKPLILNDFMVFPGLNTYRGSTWNEPAPFLSKHFPVYLTTLPMAQSIWRSATSWTGSTCSRDEGLFVYSLGPRPTLGPTQSPTRRVPQAVSPW